MNTPRPLPYAWDDLKRRLQGQIGQLLARLGLDATPKGGMVHPLNPTRNDRKPGSFVIWTSHGRDGAVGAWKDYATGEKGDVFDLVAYVLRLQGKMDAYWWALDFLGLGKGVVRSKAEADADRERYERERAAAAARAEKESDEKSAKLAAHWFALKPLAGTLAETYLRRARGIDLSLLHHLPNALRFDPRCDHIDLETGEVTAWPAMVSAVTRGKKVTGLHRTWLAPDGMGKAPVAKAKMMFGACKGGAIRLSPGASGLSPSKAAKAGRRDPLIIGEGIETVLTAATAQPDYRAWAAASLSMMGLFDWPDCADAVVLLKENDLGDQAVAAFARVEAHWRAQAAGRLVKVVASEVGSDFNDWARAA